MIIQYPDQYYCTTSTLSNIRYISAESAISHFALAKHNFYVAFLTLESSSSRLCYLYLFLRLCTQLCSHLLVSTTIADFRSHLSELAVVDTVLPFSLVVFRSSHSSAYYIICLHVHELSNTNKKQIFNFTLSHICRIYSVTFTWIYTFSQVSTKSALVRPSSYSCAILSYR